MREGYFTRRREGRRGILGQLWGGSQSGDWRPQGNPVKGRQSLGVTKPAAAWLTVYDIYLRSLSYRSGSNGWPRPVLRVNTSGRVGSTRAWYLFGRRKAAPQMVL